MVMMAVVLSSHKSAYRVLGYLPLFCAGAVVERHHHARGALNPELQHFVRHWFVVVLALHHLRKHASYFGVGKVKELHYSTYCTVVSYTTPLHIAGSIMDPYSSSGNDRPMCVRVHISSSVRFFGEHGCLVATMLAAPREGTIATIVRSSTMGGKA